MIDGIRVSFWEVQTVRKRLPSFSLLDRCRLSNHNASEYVRQDDAGNVLGNILSVDYECVIVQ